jgi:hypothetical protein
MRATFLTTQLRESAPYVSEAGWHQTAQLLIAAAEEIERLQAHSPPPTAAMGPPFRKRLMFRTWTPRGVANGG